MISAFNFQISAFPQEPRLEKLRPVYVKALNILNKLPVKMDMVHEHEAQKFSAELADEMAKHPE